MATNKSDVPFSIKQTNKQKNPFGFFQLPPNLSVKSVWNKMVKTILTKAVVDLKYVKNVISQNTVI